METARTMPVLVDEKAGARRLWKSCRGPEQPHGLSTLSTLSTLSMLSTLSTNSQRGGVPVGAMVTLWCSSNLMSLSPTLI